MWAHQPWRSWSCCHVRRYLTKMCDWHPMEVLIRTLSPWNAQDAQYRPFLSQFARLAFLAAGAQQAVYTLCSRLPTAVGQPSEVLTFTAADCMQTVHDMVQTSGRPRSLGWF